MTNKLSLEVTDELLREYLSKKNPGDLCTFEVAVTVDEVTDSQAVFSVEEVNFEDEEDADPVEDVEVEDKPMTESAASSPNGVSPVMIVFGKNA